LTPVQEQFPWKLILALPHLAAALRTEDTKLLGRMLRSDLAAEVSVVSPAVSKTCVHTRLPVVLCEQESKICCNLQMAAVGLFNGRRMVAAGRYHSSNKSHRLCLKQL